MTGLFFAMLVGVLPKSMRHRKVDLNCRELRLTAQGVFEHEVELFWPIERRLAFHAFCIAASCRQRGRASPSAVSHLGRLTQCIYQVSSHREPTTKPSARPIDQAQNKILRSLLRSLLLFALSGRDDKMYDHRQR